MLEDMLPEEVSASDPRLDYAINAVVATGTGVAIGQAIGLYEGAQGAELMVATLRDVARKAVEGSASGSGLGTSA